MSNDDLSDHKADDRIALVTGANGGLGRWCVLGLAKAKVTVVLGCRSPERGQATVAWIRRRIPDARLEVLALDLATLSSVRESAERFVAQHDKLDILINNAGVMMLPAALTHDGFEQQFAINYLSHYALTAHLWPLLMASVEPRVVSVSSLMANQGHIRLGDLGGIRGYSRTQAYAQSKLACLLFARELSRRAQANNVVLISAAAHPGFANTGLQRRTGRANLGRVGEYAMLAANLAFAQPAQRGAIPLLEAALAPGLANGAYLGPSGPGELWGHRAKLARLPRAARDDEVAAELWDLSATLSGVQPPL
ncbi:MAG: SDR family oxidoreductase [Ferrimicrobium sp.]|jgi:NAD(P)-dependent dehydrogenase (short-subunit alcohol dehydrogenase family)|nr:SDR family oxidoreductase [Ferrimicrobium sp.]